jgi:hypothetical protein
MYKYTSELRADELGINVPTSFKKYFLIVQCSAPPRLFSSFPVCYHTYQISTLWLHFSK